MSFFVHSPGREDAEIVEIDASEQVRVLVAELEPDGHVWLEEVDEEIDLDITIEEAGIRHHHHVHRGRCHRVAVVVRYNGINYEHEFGPARTIKTVKAWAVGDTAANLSPAEAVKHVLALPGADHFLDGAVHIGSLVTPGACNVVLDLLPRSRFEG